MINLNCLTDIVSDIQDYIEQIIKKHDTLTIHPFYVYINRINNRFVF